MSDDEPADTIVLLMMFSLMFLPLFLSMCQSQCQSDDAVQTDVPAERAP